MTARTYDQLSNQSECMQGVWKKCLKCFVNNFEGFDKDKHVCFINKKIVELANMLNLDVEVEDTEKLVEYVEGELTNEDLIELEATPWTPTSLSISLPSSSLPRPSTTPDNPADNSNDDAPHLSTNLPNDLVIGTELGR
ncbi:hypothetical protein OTU49_007356 [Cherax quadricarinatus]|uniref:Uncharacterized protein n=1 Tax=Cherax quadricarinatus TaxID=27406 RepID=A0AAW0WX17_CHEQU